MTNAVKTVAVTTVLFVVVASVCLVSYIRRTDIYGAIRSGDTAALRAMLERSPELIYDREDMGPTPLHVAAEKGNADMVEMLIQYGLPPGQVDVLCNTPLHVASAKGHREAAAVLLEKGARPNARNNQADTPLHLAADAGHVEIARILIEAGADINAKDYLNQTPLKRAADRGKKQVADLLRTHEAKEQ